MAIQQKPELKRVKVDEHIKQSKSHKATGNPRGRPRKNFDGPAETRGTPNGTSAGIPIHSVPADGSPSAAPRTASDTIRGAGKDNSTFTRNTSTAPIQVIPAYDTTEEAKGIISAPFSAVAVLTKTPAFALTVPELEALMPSWKTVYDKRIAPYMGDYADIYAFSFVMVNVVMTKAKAYNEAHPRRLRVAPVQEIKTGPTIQTTEAKEIKITEAKAEPNAFEKLSETMFPGNGELNS